MINRTKVVWPHFRGMDEDNEVVVQVAMEMSLDEWKAMQEVNRPKVEFNIRKAQDKIPSKAKVIHESKYLEVRIKICLRIQ